MNFYAMYIDVAVNFCTGKEDIYALSMNNDDKAQKPLHNNVAICMQPEHFMILHGSETII